MDLYELIIIAFSLSMDAFAVSICKGASLRNISLKSMIRVGMFFGLFQAIMPLIGYVLGISIVDKIRVVDHYIVLIMLGLIGIIMIIDAFKNEGLDESLDLKNMLILSVATSIDALSIGITLSLLNVSIFLSCIIIGVFTFVLSTIGVKIGYNFGKKYKISACIIGGIVLILIGIKIFLEHLGIINF